LKLNFEISDNLLTILNNVKDFDHEVGGMIFGSKDVFKTDLRSFSIKHGLSFSIDFTLNDKQLFCPPDLLTIVGTWHLHPANNADIPSITDKKQWLLWGSDYVHIILSKTGCTLYFFDSRIIFHHDFEGGVSL